MKPTTEEIRKAVDGLPEEFDIRVLDDAWYSKRAITRALATSITNEELDKILAVTVVRVGLPRMGCVELHPNDDGTVTARCYCCFGGNPDQGTHTLDKIRDAVLSLKDHTCPPWPG